MAELAAMLAKIERRLKRKRRPPNTRDLEIYTAVRVLGRVQTDVAMEHGISAGRVWQVIRRVEEYWADHEPQDDSRHVMFHPAARKQLDWERLEEILLSSMQDAEQAREGLRTSRQRHSDRHGSSSESLTRKMPGTGPLRLALRAMEMQWRLEDRPQFEPGAKRGERDIEFLVRLLVGIREQACGVQRGTQSARDEVCQWLHVLAEPGAIGNARPATGRLEGEEKPASPLALKASDEPATGDAGVLPLRADTFDVNKDRQVSCDDDSGCKLPLTEAENERNASENASPSAGGPIKDDGFVLTIPPSLRTSVESDGTKTACRS